MGCTFLELYEAIRSNKIDLGGWTFPEKLQNAKVSVAVGKNKIDCDAAIMSNKLVTTIQVFGHYIRYSLQGESNTESSAQCSSTSCGSGPNHSRNISQDNTEQSTGTVLNEI